MSNVAIESAALYLSHRLWLADDSPPAHAHWALADELRSKSGGPIYQDITLDIQITDS
jgi:hypothetical protein